MNMKNILQDLQKIYNILFCRHILDILKKKHKFSNIHEIIAQKNLLYVKVRPAKQIEKNWAVENN